MTYLLIDIQRNKKSPNSVKRIFKNFKIYGTVNAPINKRKLIGDNEAIKTTILGYFVAYPMSFLRSVALQTGISKDPIHRILLKYNYYPYFISLVQHLKDTHLLRRVQFCEFILMMFQANFQFLYNIIWSEDAKFPKNCLFNRPNSHFWCDSNLHATRVQNFQET